MHLIFSAPWQRAIIDEESEARFQAQMRDRLGEDLYVRLSALKRELEGNPHRAEALAFLQY